MEDDLTFLSNLATRMRRRNKRLDSESARTVSAAFPPFSRRRLFLPFAATSSHSRHVFVCVLFCFPSRQATEAVAKTTWMRLRRAKGAVSRFKHAKPKKQGHEALVQKFVGEFFSPSAGRHLLVLFLACPGLLFRIGSPRLPAFADSPSLPRSILMFPLSIGRALSAFCATEVPILPCLPTLPLVIVRRVARAKRPICVAQDQ